MRRFKVRYRPEALADLAAIYRHLRRAGFEPVVAFQVVGRIRERCRRIGDVPLGGRPRDDIVAGLRTVPFENKAVIAYVVQNDGVRIVNVFYGGRDYEALDWQDRPGRGSS